MPKTDDEWFRMRYAARLRAELDRVRPSASTPRYLHSRSHVALWRLAPATLAVAIAGILSLTAWAATGTPNPRVWTQRVENVINPPSPSPSLEPASPAAQPQSAPPAATRAPAPATERAEPSGGDEHESPQASPAPRPSPSPEHSDDHSGATWPGGTASPSPTGDR